MSPSGVDQALLAQGRALGDPTRHAVFAYVRDSGRPVGVAELAGHFGLNHNAVRQHLAKLRDAGLMIEERLPPAGPGRPPLRYRPTPGAADRWGGTGPHEELSMILLDLLGGDVTPRQAGRRAGRRLAAEGNAGADPLVVLEAVARRLGFEPQVEATATGADVVLQRCPFLGPATAAPGVVCEIHRGIAEGIVEVTGGDVAVADLAARPPQRAGCRIKVVIPA